MEQYNVEIFPAAQNDLTHIVDYLNTLSATAAARQYDFIVEKIGSLQTMPERCAPAKGTQLRLRGYRLLMIENYIVFFVIKERTVEIRRILYAKRQYKDLL